VPVEVCHLSVTQVTKMTQEVKHHQKVSNHKEQQARSKKYAS